MVSLVPGAAIDNTTTTTYTFTPTSTALQNVATTYNHYYYTSTTPTFNVVDNYVNMEIKYLHYLQQV